MIQHRQFVSFRFLRVVFSILVLASLRLQAATYYVDSNQGDDNMVGTDATTPWKTIEKVNKTDLQAGDKVLLKRGGVWSGQLTIHNAGGDGNPIYIGAYGDETQAKPTINGEGKVGAAVFIKNGSNHVTVEGLALTNFDGQDIFDGAEGDRCGVRAGEWGGDLSDIKILHNEVYFIEGFSNHGKVGPPRGTNLDPNKNNQYGTGAIFAHAVQMADVTIDGNEVHDCTGTGIMVFAQKNITGALVQNNRLNNIGSDGIEFLNATSPVIQYNSCINAANNSGEAPRGPGVLGYHGLACCGMWAFHSSDVLFQYNYCEGTHQIKYDGQAWDFDLNMSGTCVYQYNFSRDNEGGFILSNNEKHPGYTRICRYNISVNDGSKQGKGEWFFNGISDYYNNIFYRTDGKSFFLDDKKMTGHQSGTFTNNIFYTTATANLNYATATRIFSHNCFYGHTPIDPGTGAVLADPLFQDVDGAVAAHALKDVAGFKLKPGSPCLGAGDAIPDFNGKNFWGDPLPMGQANIGAE